MESEIIVQETGIVQDITTVPVQTKAIIEIKKSPLELLAEKKLAELQELNPGLVLDFLHVWTRMKPNKKGQFMYTLGDEETNLGDEIDIKILCGEQIYQLWGEEDSDEQGELLCYSKDKKTGYEGTNCSECNDFDNCRLRYALLIQLIEEDPDEECFLLNLPTTSTYAFGDYIKLLAKKYKKGAAGVVTKMYTKEETVKSDSAKTYNAIKFGYSPNQNKFK